MASNRRDYYLNKRSWLIDTAETPEDQKNLKRDLAKLDAKFYPNIEYDFSLDLMNRTFKKLDEYNDIELHFITSIPSKFRYWYIFYLHFRS